MQDDLELEDEEVFCIDDGKLSETNEGQHLMEKGGTSKEREATD